MVTQVAATYIITINYAAHSLLEWLLSYWGNKEDPIPYVTKLELTYISVQALFRLLRPIVSSRGYVTYGVAKVIAKVLKPLVDKLPHHIQSTSEYVSKVREVTLLPGECISSYNVTALFTSVPTDSALKIIKDLLEKDDTLSNRSVLSVQNITEHLGFCLHNTYFSFQIKFYEQVEDTAMGLLVSPIVTNLYMMHFEGEALRSASYPPGIGIGLLMTLGSFNNKATSNFCWITSTHRSKCKVHSQR